MQLPKPFVALGVFCLATATLCAQTITGELKQWHRVTLTFDGPSAGETGEPNPFRDYRLAVTFTHGDERYAVPGYFAADGNAANSGATTGNQWRVHFSPDQPGDWTYTVDMRQGKDVAVTDAPGTEIAPHGLKGKLSIEPTDKQGRDFRAQGRLDYVGEHYLRFAGSGQWFIKGGADSPENFLGYADFDGTYAILRNQKQHREGEAAPSPLHRYEPHLGDWNPGDPTWHDGRGKAMIGALNYLAGKGMNSVYFLTMNHTGDGNDVWPWIDHEQRDRFDCSKLDQWEIVFEHMEHLGLMMHVVTQETENDQLLDGGELGELRRLYYRELIARFGHHLALVWNLGEENTNTPAQLKAFCDYFHAVDCYQHPVVVHTFPNWYDRVYQPLIGHPTFEGASLQMGEPAATHAETLKWVTASEKAGRKWIVCLDEIGPAHTGVKPDADDPDHEEVVRHPLWGNLLAGGAGAEWYFGYKWPHNDLNCEDWRSRDHMWDLTRHALDFFQCYLPFTEMRGADTYTERTDDFCFAKPGEVYAVYVPKGSGTRLYLPEATYSVRWFDPFAGGELQSGSIAKLRGPGNLSLGNPPRDTGKDWVALVKLEGAAPKVVPPPPNPPAPTVESLTLLDASTGKPVPGFSKLKDGAVIKLSEVEAKSFSIRANAEEAGSVRFAFAGKANFRTESSRPYTLGGDTADQIKAVPLTVGEHEITATAYAGSGAQGAAGKGLTIRFTVEP